MTRARAEQGSAAIWVLVCGALLVVVAGVGTVRALAVLARHHAESSADLAALAAAADIGVGGRPCIDAAEVARENGASLRSCQLRLDADGRSGTVVVQVSYSIRLPAVGPREVLASARAARLEAGPGPAGPGRAVAEATGRCAALWHADEAGRRDRRRS